MAYRTCRVCRKRFWVEDVERYIYHKHPWGERENWFCGWNCMRKWEKRREQVAKLPRSPVK